MEITKPKILDDLVKELMSQGYKEEQAWAMATSILQRQGKLPKHPKKFKYQI